MDRGTNLFVFSVSELPISPILNLLPERLVGVHTDKYSHPQKHSVRFQLATPRLVGLAYKGIHCWMPKRTCTHEVPSNVGLPIEI